MTSSGAHPVRRTVSGHSGMAVCLLVLLMCSWPAAAGETLSFGIVPQQAASTLARAWQPLLNRLSGTTGVTLVFATAPDIPAFEQRLAAGTYDFAYMNPYHYTVFAQEPGYTAFAREDKRIRGIVVVAGDSQLQSIRDLDGASVAFPAPAAFAATVLPLAEFRSMGIHVSPVFVSSHDSVYMAVQRGLYPAGGGIQRTFAATTPAVRGALRVLWTTPEHTPHAFAVHPRVDRAILQTVAQALLSLDLDAEGQALLGSLQMSPLVKAQDADWDDVRALRIHELDLTTPDQTAP